VSLPLYNSLPITAARTHRPATASLCRSLSSDHAARASPRVESSAALWNLWWVAAESIHPLKGESHQGPCSCLQSIVFTADLAAAAPALFSPPSPTPLQQVFFLVLSFRFHFSFTPKHFRCLFLRPVPAGLAIWVVLATRLDELVYPFPSSGFVLLFLIRDCVVVGKCSFLESKGTHYYSRSWAQLIIRSFS
jgi:hypothetical protein